MIRILGVGRGQVSLFPLLYVFPEFSKLLPCVCFNFMAAGGVLPVICYHLDAMALCVESLMYGGSGAE